MQSIAQNLAVIRDKIKTASIGSGREPNSVTLIAVSKGKSDEDVRAALRAGQMVFGENRVQEAKAKYTDLKTNHKNLVLHLIGPLQTNKVEEAVKLFDVIETLDRKRLADSLFAALKKSNKLLECFIEVNVGNEFQKSGIMIAELPVFLKYCRINCELNVTGLMCIPPQNEDPTPFFQELKKLADQQGLHKISMGMSNDFEIAVREGATEVRVGTAIFGSRRQP